MAISMALLHKIAGFCTREASAGCDISEQQMLSASPGMRSVQLQLLRVKDGISPVLLLGETGVGKEVAARQLHEASMRRDMPFVVVNCAGVPADRAEIELFGCERDAVPGSAWRKSVWWNRRVPAFCSWMRYPHCQTRAVIFIGLALPSDHRVAETALRTF
jgi:sigma54-dependent transcription regulator